MKKVSQKIYIGEASHSKTSKLDWNSLETVRKLKLKVKNELLFFTKKPIARGVSVIGSQAVDITGGLSGSVSKEHLSRFPTIKKMGLKHYYRYSVYSKRPISKGVTTLKQTLEKRRWYGTDQRTGIMDVAI